MSGQAGGVGRKTYARQSSGVTAGIPGWWTGRAAAGVLVTLLLTAALAVAGACLSRAAAVSAVSTKPAVAELARDVGGTAPRRGSCLSMAPKGFATFLEGVRVAGACTTGRREFGWDDSSGTQGTQRTQGTEGGGAVGAAPAVMEPAGVNSPVNDPVIGQGTGFLDWFERDVEYLEALGGRSSHGDAAARDDAVLTARISREIARLREVITCLDESPSYRDSDLGFSVYDTKATGWLHVLSVALRTREDLLAALRSPLVGWVTAARETAVREAAVREADALYRLNDGTPLYEADPSRLPQVDEVVSTLRSMDLPRAAFEGYRVYLLPFSMGDVSGLGASGYTLVGAAASGREVIANQVPVTVAHEFGHHIQLGAMGGTYRDNPAGWRRYMGLRGIPEWTVDGKVNTRAWAKSPEETFAEDVRVLFGPPAASQEPYGTAYPDPRNDPDLAAGLREFITAQAATQPRRADPGGAERLSRAESVAGDMGPWLRPTRTVSSSWAVLRTLLEMCCERIADGP
ncbi:MAG: hypothetical protein ACM309_07185 [Bacillota bacterium]